MKIWMNYVFYRAEIQSQWLVCSISILSFHSKYVNFFLLRLHTKVFCLCTMPNPYLDWKLNSSTFQQNNSQVYIPFGSDAIKARSEACVLAFLRNHLSHVFVVLLAQKNEFLLWPCIKIAYFIDLFLYFHRKK